MTLTVDERARIPFALLGALLLVTSVSVAATIQQTPSGEVETTTGETVERLAATETTVLREGTRAAGAQAAADPVITPSNTTYGRLLNDEQPYRTQLELLTYVEVANRLDGAGVRIGDTTAESRLPAVTNVSTARQALDRTRVEPAGPGAVDVKIEGVERVVYRGGRELEREETTMQERVATPALTLHERTSEYEQRLDSGPATPGTIGPGFSGRVNGIAWARGLAQYAGAPIEQVLAPRHVELAINDAIRAQQRTVFGTEDERLRRGLARQGTRMVQSAINRGTNRSNLAAEVRAPNAERGTALKSDYRPKWFERDRSRQPTTVSVGKHAGTALDRLFVGEGGPSLADVIQEVYSAEIHAEHAARIQESETTESPDRVGSDWTHVDTAETIRILETDRTTGRGAAPSLPPGWRSIETVNRLVKTERIIVRTYERGDERTRTTERRRETHAVSIEIGIRVGQSSHAPERSRAGFEAVGQFDTIDETALDAYYDEAGSPNRLASRAVRSGRLPNATVETDPPPELEATIRDELWGLEESLEAEEVTVDRARIATDANPHGELADRIDQQREQYVRAPASYSGPRQKAKVAARGAYIDRLLDDLETGSEAVESAQSGIEVASRVNKSAGGAPVDDILVASADVTAPTAGSIETVSPTETLELTVESDPGYLPGAGVDPEHLRTGNETHYPIAIRTVNVVSLPTAAIANTVAERIGEFLFDDADRVSLTTAAQSLAAVEEVPPAARTDELKRNRAALREQVAAGLAILEADAVANLKQVTALDREERMRVVENGFNRTDSLHGDVIEAGNGTVSTAIADEVAAHESTPSDPTYRERVELRMETTIRNSLNNESASIPEGPVSKAVDSARGRTEAVVSDVTERGLERGQHRLSRRLSSGSGRIPLGVPVAPPHSWVATVNGWTAEVRGEYASFAVRSNRGGPANAAVVYQRHGEPVTFDIDGDRTRERLGRADRVNFRTWTTAVVAVPPGKSGVGNTDGRMVLKTPAWSKPGFERQVDSADSPNSTDANTTESTG